LKVLLSNLIYIRFARIFSDFMESCFEHFGGGFFIIITHTDHNLFFSCLNMLFSTRNTISCCRYFFWSQFIKSNFRPFYSTFFSYNFFYHPERLIFPELVIIKSQTASFINNFNSTNVSFPLSILFL